MNQQSKVLLGARLFRVRGNYIHAVYLIGTIVAYFHHKLGPFASEEANHIWFWIALGVAITGALLRVYVNGHAALGTSGRRKRAAEAAELNVTGAYSLVRNPLYVGRIINFTGLAMLTGSAVYGGIILALSIWIYMQICAFEADFLNAKFGDEYRLWAAKVPSLLPRLQGWAPPKYPFWWRRMLWREYRKFFQLGNALLFYDLARRGFNHQALPENLLCYYAYGVLLIARIGMKVAKEVGMFSDLK